MGHSDVEQVDDKTYADALAYVNGRQLGHLYWGLRSTDIEHGDALELVREYMSATIYAGRPDGGDDD